MEALASRNLRVIYLGSIPYRAVPGVVAGSIGGLVPKNNIGGHVKTGLSPLKLFETLACGVPVVVTGFPGMADLVTRNECGIVIPIDDPKALAQAVAYLYEHHEKRIKVGMRGRRAVEKEHSWAKRAEDTELVLFRVRGSD